eukprot:5018098-Prymnesium_polylepis.1
MAHRIIVHASSVAVCGVCCMNRHAARHMPPRSFSSWSSGSWSPMLPSRFETGPARPCCDEYDASRFLTRLRSRSTGRTSSPS